MRIALTHTRFQRHGGVEGIIFHLARGLLAAGDEVHVFCDRWEHLEHERLRFHRVRPLRAGEACKVWSFDRRLRRALDRHELDIVHGFTKTSRQDVYTDGSGTLEAFERFSLPARDPLRRILRRWGPHRRVVARLEAERYRRGSFRRVIAMSKMALGQVAGRYGLGDGEIEVVYNGVDLEAFSPAVRQRERAAVRAQLGLGDVPVVLFVGNDDRRKGADLLVRAVARAGAGDAPRWRCVLAGRLRDEARLRRIAAEGGVTLDLLGPRSDIPRLLAAADALALPSRFDIFGQVVLEAMAAGVPPLVSRAAGASELVDHDEDGWLFGADDGEGLTEGLRRLAAPDRREAMGRKARRTAEAHSQDAHVRRVREIYAEVLAEKRGEASPPPGSPTTPVSRAVR